MSATCTILDQFDPAVTGDPVFTNIWAEIKNFVPDIDTGYVVRAVFLKLWCIQQMQQGCSKDNLTKHTSALDALFDEKDMDDELAGALESLSIKPEFKIDVDDCIALYRELAATHRSIKHRAAKTMETMIDCSGYRTPEICATRQLTDLARMLLSITTDAYHNRQSISTEMPFKPEEETQVQVITHLNLCGGIPSSFQPLNLPHRARALLVVGAITNIHQLIRAQDPSRLGVLTENLEDGGFWHFQAAMSLSDLDDDGWTALVDDDDVDEMKQEGGTVFIANVSIWISFEFWTSSHHSRHQM